MTRLLDALFEAMVRRHGWDQAGVESREKNLNYMQKVITESDEKVVAALEEIVESFLNQVDTSVIH
jgi:hypothetical protein